MFNKALQRHLKLYVRKIETFNPNAGRFSPLLFTNSISILQSNVDANKNIDTEHKFKDYQYAFAQVFLTKNDDSTSICANMKVEIILTNITFFISIIRNVLIRIMTILNKVRDLNVKKHSTNKYAIVSMYFSKKR